MATHEFVDRKGLLPPGMRLQYHSRSDEHSKKLGELVVEDLLDHCALMHRHAALGQIAYGINYRFRWPNGKEKTLDLVIGVPSVALTAPPNGRIHRLSGRGSSASIARLLVACEEKSTMTEHGKSQPRIYSELNDAHTIVHQGSRHTIATLSANNR